MIDTTTAYLKLPLPHEDNLLTDDVTRLREAFTGLDDHAASADAGLEEAAKTAEWDKVSGKPTAYPPVDHGHPAQTTVSGNAGSATKLKTARTLQTNLASTTGANFDGSANANLGVTGILPVANGGTGNATGKAASATTASSCTGNSATATKLAAARTLQTNLATTTAAKFDGSANVAPGVTGILPVANGGTGNATGNAATATKLAEARTISLAGAVTGSVSFDGSANVSITTTSSLTGVLYASKTLIPRKGSFDFGPPQHTTPNTANLPSGGTWAYDIVIGGMSVRNTDGVAGGSVVYSWGFSNSSISPETMIANSSGNYWRIA